HPMGHIVEEAHAGAEHDRVNHEAELIEHLIAQERTHEPGLPGIWMFFPACCLSPATSLRIAALLSESDHRSLGGARCIRGGQGNLGWSLPAYGTERLRDGLRREDCGAIATDPLRRQGVVEKRMVGG